MENHLNSAEQPPFEPAAPLPSTNLPEAYDVAEDWLPLTQSVRPVAKVTKVNILAKPTVKAPLRLMAVALGLGICANFLFYGKPIGVSVLIFVLLLFGALFGLGKLERVRFTERNLLLLLPMLFFAVMLAIRTNQGLTILNIGAIIFLFSLMIFFYTADHLSRLSVFGYPIVFLKVLNSAFLDAAPLVGSNTAKIKGYKKGFRLATPIVRGVLIAIPILTIFAILLASADSIFADMLGKVFRFDNRINFGEIFGRILLILLVMWAVTGNFVYAYVRYRGRGNAARPENLPGTLVPNPIIGFQENTVVLVLVNLLFGAFAWIQFAYLFSGQAYKGMDYIQYQAYVQRGFGELLTAAVLTMLLILGLRWLAKPQSPLQSFIISLLSTITIALAIVMIVSAFQRMIVWEGIEYYVNTQLRIYVRSFILWLGLTFGWLFITLWLKKSRFPIGLFVALLGFLVTVNIMNPDADVAIANIERYQNSSYAQELATRYLWQLSDDAVPSLVSALDHTSGQVNRDIRDNLLNRWQKLEYDKSWQDWASFNLMRWQTYETLTNLHKQNRI